MKTVLAALFGAVGSTLTNWRVILLLWALNLLAAWVLVAPAADAIERSLAHSHVAADLLAVFDDEALLDIEHDEGEILTATRSNLSRAVLPWIVLSAMLSSALAWQLLRRDERRGLFAGVGRYGHRAVWLLATTFGVLWCVARLNDWLSALVTGWLTEGNLDASAGTLNGLWLGKLVVMALVVGLVLTAHRVARLRLVALDERCAPLTWLRGLLGTLRHPFAAGLGALLSWLPLLVVLTVYAWLAPRLVVDDAWLPTIKTSWRLILLFQVTQLLVQACLVYRTAVDVRLWPVFAPPAEPGAALPAPVVAPSAPAAPAAPPTDAPADDGAADGDASHEPAFTRRVSARLGLPGLAGLASERGAAGRPLRDPPARRGPVLACVAVLAGACLWPAMAQDAGNAQLRNRYVMDVTLDLEGHTATIASEATFVNATAEPVDELWLHLYANAFSNDHTLWMRDRRGGPVAERGPEHGGYIDVRAVRLADGGDLATSTTIAGDAADGPTGDPTLMRVALPAPVAPGASVTLQLDAVTRFPRTVARMGMNGLHLDGMQWFPKFCAHDERGWNTQPFWGTGEFFADFGSYDVTFEWPAEIGGRAVELEATGVPEELTAPTGRLRRRYTAQDVHDFAFCADPAFERFEDTWTAPDGREVQLVYLCQPYATPKARYVLEVLKSNLRDSAAWWMPYPYPRLVVDGLPHNMGGGMEYPMLFTISMPTPTLDWINDKTADPAGVTAHEFGHQYYYGLAASNEMEEAWLDEGLNTWATARMVEGHFGAPEPPTDALSFLGTRLVRDVLAGSWKGSVMGEPWLDPALVLGWRRSPFNGSALAREPSSSPSLLGFRVPNLNSLRELGFGVDRWAWLKPRYLADATARPLTTPSREFTRGYGALVYRKTALVMTTLERHVGREAMDGIIASYLDQHAYGHPTGEDFLAVVSEATGGAHDAWLRQLIETTATVDFRVEEVSSREVGELVGYAPQARPGDVVAWQGPEQPRVREPAPIWESWWSAITSAPFPGSEDDDSADDDSADDGAPGGDDATRGDDVAGAGDAASGDRGGLGGIRPLPPELTGGEPVRWRTRYVVRQQGGVRAPVEVEARFADGEVVRQTWDGQDSYAIFEHETASRLVEVVVDPERRFALELDVTDNGYALKRATETVRGLQAWAHFVAQSSLAAWTAAF